MVFTSFKNENPVFSWPDCPKWAGFVAKFPWFCLDLRSFAGLFEGGLAILINLVFSRNIQVFRVIDRLARPYLAMFFVVS